VTLRSLFLCCAALAAACFLPPAYVPPETEVRCIDQDGRDTACPPGFAQVVVPRRNTVTLLSPLHDFAYAAADAGPEGCLWILAAIALLAIVLGLWSHGFRGAFRRAVLVLSLGAPICLALLYLSCLLDGRVIRLGPEAIDYVPASLHNHTDRSTGLLSPKDMVIWHAKRGFRVLNVSDKDTIRGGVLAREAAARIEEENGPFVPPLLVTVGEEWHGQPDIVFVNVTHEPAPPPRLPRGLDDAEIRARRLPFVTALAKTVHAEGGALFLAHPWSKVPAAMSLEDLFDAGVDGVEVVNGVIHGGDARIRAAVDAEKRIFGVIDYKFGPHVNAMTLLDAQLARTPEGVAKAVREGRTLVLYAIPGGPRSSEVWRAAAVGLRGAMEGIDSLREAPMRRRGIWFAWGVTGMLLWWITTRGREGLKKAAARTLFAVCASAELGLLLFLWSDVRFMVGTVPVPVLIAVAGLLAVPLLAASHSLGLLERHR